MAIGQSYQLNSHYNLQEMTDIEFTMVHKIIQQTGQYSKELLLYSRKSELDKSVHTFLVTSSSSSNL
jgi:hypothetical protein